MASFPGRAASTRLGVALARELSDGTGVVTGTSVASDDDPRVAYQRVYREIAGKLPAPVEPAPNLKPQAARPSLLQRLLGIPAWQLGGAVATLLLAPFVVMVVSKTQAEAETLHQRALAIREKALGPDHPDVATSLNNLAALYSKQGKYAEAEPLYKRSLAIREKALGPDHPNVATSLSSLAGVYGNQGKYAEAEPLHQRALAIREKALGPDHPDIATSLNNLAVMYLNQKKYADAEPFFKRSLAICRKGPRPNHSSVAMNLNNLAGVYGNRGKYAEAEPLHQRALAIREKALGPDDPMFAMSLHNLALLSVRETRQVRRGGKVPQTLARQ